MFTFEWTIDSRILQRLLLFLWQRVCPFLLFYLFEIRKVSIWVFKSHYVLPEQVNTGVHLFHHGYIVV